jgi:hypothetical protein
MGIMQRPRVRRALATPEHAPALSPVHATPRQPRAHVCARDYKADPSLDRTTPLALNPARAPVHQ